MPKSTKEFTKITSLIKLILNGYPGNWAIIREYLQNSDDSGATRQVFILDERQYPTESLVDAVLVGSQGPALVAINNGIITDKDWEALLKINSSSKQEDQTQTGKNGLGFRASYHLTENPHILSGGTLMILDPHNEFTKHPGGLSIDIINEGEDYPDQILPFMSCIEGLTFPYNGTAFRLPLRTAQQAHKSEVKQTPTTVADIREVLNEFSTRELEEAILFLKHITSIQIFHIDPSGRKVCLAEVTVNPPLPSPCPPTLIRRTITTICSTNGGGPSTSSREWKLYYSAKTKAEAEYEMNQRLGYDIGNRLTQDKLSATVDIAFPLDGPFARGRLFTLLPLPQYTEFPFHLNAVFALDPSRQYLKNIQEIGVANSRERLLVEWNKAIFNTWTPGIWCDLLAGLPSNLLLSENWKLWPPEEHGEDCYWAGLTGIFTNMVVSRNLAVFPTVSGTPRLVRIADPNVLLASSDTQISLSLLSKIGISIIQPPRNVYIALVSGKHAVTLSPESLHDVLLRKAPSEYEECEDSDLKIVMDYLVFASGSADLKNLAGLPWFRRAKDNRRVCLELAGHGNPKYLIPQTDVEVKIFVDGHNMLGWNTFSDRLRTQLSQPSASRILNVAVLKPQDVVSFLKSRLGHLQSPNKEISNAKLDCDYAIDFWNWVVHWSKGEIFFQSCIGEISELFLLPTSRGSLRKFSSGIIHFDSIDAPFVGAWNALGIYSISGDISYIAIVKLRSAAAIPGRKSWNQILFLINNANLTTSSTCSQHVFDDIREYLSENLPRANANLTAEQKAKFRQFPIFKVRDVRTGNTSMSRIDGHCVYIQVGEALSLPFLKGYPNLIYVDAHDSATLSFLRLLDNNVKIENEFSILQMAIDNWDIQPNEKQDNFIDQIFRYRPNQLPTLLRKMLATIPFVIVNGSLERKPPMDLIHPNSTIANLYLGEPGRMPAGRFGEDHLLAVMHEFGFLRSRLDVDVVRDRIAYLINPSNAADGHLINKARGLITILNHEWKSDYTHIIKEHRSTNWIPCDEPSARLVSPSSSRDDYRDDHTHPYYFDRVLTYLRTTTFKPEFRTALGWSTAISSQILVGQLKATLDHSENRANRLIELLKYLNRLRSSNSIDQLALQNFRSVVNDRGWVPSTDDVIHSRYALLLEPSGSRLQFPFQFVRPELLKYRPILHAFGCSDRPPLDVLITELDRLYETNPLNIEACLCILQEIVDHHKRELSNDGINIPGDDGRGHPLLSTYFRDSPIHSLNFPASLQGKFAAHEGISPLLAQSLRIPRLSSLLLGDDDDEEEEEQMGIDFVTVVRKFLSDYDPRYAINEMLANADDARASSFSVLLDHRRLSPLGNVLNPQFKSAISKETLFFHNDSRLTQADLKGIRRVGRGGKQGDVDTHGRHGLGALSLYYFTDVATIISGDTVLILDPSSKYLPPSLKGGRRTLVERKISDLASIFPGQLERYEGLFGFSSKGSDYNGTIFCLPLNATITEKADTSVKINEYLDRSYRQLASLALLFATNLQSITAKRLEAQQESTIWSFSASRTDVLSPLHQFEHHLLKIHERGQTDRETKWSIATSQMGEIPQEFYKMCQVLKLTPGTKVQLAINSRAVEVRTFRGYPFSTVSLPRLTSLPFHLNARFAISSNRQDLVLNPSDSGGGKDVGTSYNTWILETLVPPLYLEALSLLMSRKRKNRAEAEVDGRTSQWFLTQCTDVASQKIRDAFFKALPNSNHAIFMDARGSLISFPEAVFSKGEPKEVTECLNQLETPNFVSHDQYKHIAQIDGSTFVSPSFVRMACMTNPESTHSFFSDAPNKCSAILTYFSEESDESVSLIGLPLLVLRSREIISVPDASDPPVYHSDEPSHASLFSSSQFMDSGSYTQPAVERLLNDPSINVTSLTEHNAIHLIGVELQNSSKQRIHRWVHNFWGQHHITLPGPPSIELLETARLRLIEATRSSDFSLLPLHECQPDTVIYNTGLDQQLVEIFHILDIAVITSKHNKFLKEFLKKRFKGNTLSNVLECIVAKGIDNFASLNSLSANHLSSWIQGHLYEALNLWTEDPSSVPVRKSDLLKLPIWQVYSNRSLRRGSAMGLLILPDRIGIGAIAPYLNRDTTVAPYSYLIIRFLEFCSSGSRTPIICPPSDLLSVLSLPSTVTSDDEIKRMKDFMKSIFEYSDDSLNLCALSVPDSHGTLRPVKELYDDSITLFRSTLRFTQCPSFLHEKFKSFLLRLRKLGLIHQITIETFEHCANAVSAAHHDCFRNAELRRDMLSAVIQMSKDAFETYQSQIPALILLERHSGWRWSSMDSISFVLRKGERRQGATYDIRDNYVSGNLPLILPPSSFVLPIYEPIAWTQRALFFTEPIEGLVTVNKTLGIPTAEEVVAHLVLLTTVIAQDHPGDRTLLSDIKATYSWLNKNAGSAMPHLRQSSTEKLFLNVGDPSSDSWDGNWVSSEELILNMEFDQGPVKTVQGFLKEYEALLRAAGCSEIKVSSGTAQPTLSTSNTSTAQDWKVKFDNMRKANLLTDLELLPTLEPIPTGSVQNALLADDDVAFTPISPTVASEIIGAVDDYGYAGGTKKFERKGLRAHRVMMAVAVPYLRDLQLWRQSAQPSGRDEMQFYGSPFAAKAVIDFVYTGEIELSKTTKDQVELTNLMHDLLNVLPVADEWGMTELKERIQWEIVAKHEIVRRLPQEYDTLLSYATKYSANQILVALKDLEHIRAKIQKLREKMH